MMYFCVICFNWDWGIPGWTCALRAKLNSQKKFELEIDMDNGVVKLQYKHKSGFQKRKRKEEFDKLINKLPKIVSFFKKMTQEEGEIEKEQASEAPDVKHLMRPLVVAAPWLMVAWKMQL